MRQERKVADIAAAAAAALSNQPLHCENCNTSHTVSASFVKMWSDCQIRMDILYVRAVCIDVADHPRGLHSILFPQEFQLIVIVV
jgi:hypothetical protein